MTATDNPELPATDGLELESLIAAVRAGAEYSGVYLVSIYGVRLHRYARSIGGDLSPADIERVCEETVEQAVRRIEAFDLAKGTFDGWLRGILRYQLATWRRSHRTEALVEHVDDRPDAGITAEEFTPLMAVVADAYEALQPRDQLIIRLRAFEHLPYEEIADALGGETTASACRQRYNRAKQRLRKLIVEHPNFDPTTTGLGDR